MENQSINISTQKTVNIVMGRIAKRRLVAARAWAAFHAALIASAAAMLMPALSYLSQRAYQSGFSEYASLAFSDWHFVASSWGSFLLTLAESAPIASSAAVTAIILIFLYSLRGEARDVVAMRSARRAAYCP